MDPKEIDGLRNLITELVLTDLYVLQILVEKRIREIERDNNTSPLDIASQKMEAYKMLI